MYFCPCVRSNLTTTITVIIPYWQWCCCDVIDRDNSAKGGAVPVTIGRRWSNRPYHFWHGSDCSKTRGQLSYGWRSTDTSAHLLSLWQRVDQSQLRSWHPPHPVYGAWSS